MSTDLPLRGIDPALAARAQELARRPKSSANEAVITADEAKELLQLAKDGDGRITDAELQFIEQLRLDENAKKLATTAFNPQSMSFEGQELALKAHDDATVVAEAAKLQGPVTTEAIAGWQKTGNVSALIDVWQDSKVPAAKRTEAMKALLAAGPSGLTELFDRLKASGSGLGALYQAMKASKDPDVRAGAMALLQMLAVSAEPASELAQTYLTKAHNEIPDAGALSGQAAVRRADILVASHKAAYDGILGDGKSLHDKAAKVAYGTEPARSRLDAIGGVVTGYKGLAAKLDAEIGSLNMAIAALEAELQTASGATVGPLQDRLAELRDRRASLLLTKSDFALDQADTAQAFCKVNNFAGYTAGMYQAQRGGFLAMSHGDVQTMVTDLKAERDRLSDVLKGMPAHAPGRDKLQTRLDMVSSKLQQLEMADAGLTTAGVAWARAVQAADAASAKRLGQLYGLNATISDLAAELTPELYSLALSPDANVAAAARGKLDKVRKEMMAAIELLVKDGSDFRKIGGTTQLCDVLKDVQKELAAFDFSKIDQITSFADQVKGIRTEVLTKFDAIRKSGDVRRDEVEAAFGVQQKVDEAITFVDLPAAKRGALANEALLGWSKLAYVSVPMIGQLSDAALENPGAAATIDARLTEVQGGLVKDLRQARATYIEVMTTSTMTKAQLEASPEVKLLDLLIRRAEMVGSGPVDAAKLKALDAEIDAAAAKVPATSHSLGVLTGMVRATRLAGEAMAYKSERITFSVAEGPQAAEQALAEATKQANGDKAHCYAVVDRGWTGEGANRKRLGYQVVKYPAEAFAAKTALVREGGQVDGKTVNGSVMAVAGLHDVAKPGGGTEGKVDVVSKLPNQTGTFKPGTVDASVLGDTPANGKTRHEVLDKVGAKAKELVLKQYDATIGLYSKWQGNDAALMEDLLRMVDGRSPAEVKTLLKSMFGIEDVWIHDPDGPSQQLLDADEFAARLVQLNKDVKAKLAKQPPDQAGAKALVDGYIAGGDMPDLKGGVKDRLGDLKDVRKDTAALSNEKAAFKLTKNLPTIREELYRSFGFKLDPTAEFPPSASQLADAKKTGTFTSTAELIFADSAHQWQEGEESKAFWTTVGIVAGAIAIGLVTAGIGTAAVGAGTMTAGGAALMTGGVSVTMAVGFGAHGVYEAYEFKDEAEANVAAGFWGNQAIEQAEKGVALAWGSAVVGVGLAGVSIGVGSWASKFSAAARLGIEGGMALAGTAIDPMTIDAAMRGDWKAVAFSFALNGVVTAVGFGAGEFMHKGMTKVNVTQEGDHLYLKTPQGRQRIEVVQENGKPVTGKDGELKFRFIEENGTPKKGPNGEEMAFTMKVSNAELTDLHALKPPTVKTSPAHGDPVVAPTAGKTGTAVSAPPLTPNETPKASAAVRKEPLSEGALAFHSATETLMGDMPLERMVGLKGSSSSAAADASLAHVTETMGGLKLTPEGLDLARTAFGKPMKPRNPGDFEVQSGRYKTLTTEAKGLDAQAAKLEASAASDRKLAAQFEKTGKPDMAKGLIAQAEAKEVKARHHREASDIVRAQAAFEFSLGLPKGEQAVSLGRQVRELAETHPGAAAILDTYKSGLEQVPGRLSFDDMHAIYGVENQVGTVTVKNDSAAHGQALFDLEVGKAMGNAKTKPSTKLAEMEKASVTTDRSVVDHPGSWEKAKAAVTELEGLPAKTTPSERLAFIKEKIATFKATGGDPVAARILEDLVGAYESMLRLSGVTPGRLTRTVVADGANVPTADAHLRNRVRNDKGPDGDWVHPKAIEKAEADPALWQTVLQEHGAKVTDPALANAKAEAKAIIDDPKLTSAEKLDAIIKLSNDYATGTGGKAVDDMAAGFFSELETAWRRQVKLKSWDLTLEMAATAGKTARDNVPATVDDLAKKLHSKPLPPYTDNRADLSKVPAKYEQVLPKAESLATSRLNAIRTNKALTPEQQHQALNQAIKDLRAVPANGKNPTPLEAALAADILAGYRQKVIAKEMPSVLPKHTGTDPSSLVGLTKGMTPEVQGRVDEAMGLIAELVDPKVLAAAGPVRIEVVTNPPPGFRANYKNGVMQILPDTKVKTIVHEFGHHIENKAGSGVWDAAYKYLLERMGSDASVKSIGRSSGRNAMHGEMAWTPKDPAKNLPNPYMAKIYESGDTEVLSMGMEFLASPEAAAKFYAEDPETFALIMNILRGDAQIPPR